MPSPDQAHVKILVRNKATLLGLGLNDKDYLLRRQ